MQQPPTDPATLAAADGILEYSRPVPVAQPATDLHRIQSTDATGHEAPGTPMPWPRTSIAGEEPPRVTAADFGQPENIGEPVRCACGACWFSTVNAMTVGPRRLERAPMSQPLLKCANCGQLYQENPINTLQPVQFTDAGQLAPV